MTQCMKCGTIRFSEEFNTEICEDCRLELLGYAKDAVKNFRTEMIKNITKKEVKK